MLTILLTFLIIIFMMTIVKILITIAFCSDLKKKSQTDNDGTKYVEIMETLKYFSNFWKILEMSLINCDINLILTWSANFVAATGTVTNW